MLPLSGSVLGIDVGTSQIRKSTGVCRLTWTPDAVTWRIERCAAEVVDRESTIRRVADDHHMLSVALDGPLVPGLTVPKLYRAAEQMLTLGIAKQIGKPGQSSTKVGTELNNAANVCVRDVLNCLSVSSAAHEVAIHQSAIVEAFPSSFMGVLLRDPSLVPATRHDRSDRFYALLSENGALGALLVSQLPGRRTARAFRDVTNHDDRAALICALTALCVAANDYSAVGHERDGWIVLPPLRFIAPWALPHFRSNQAGSLGGRFVAWNQGRQLGL